MRIDNATAAAALGFAAGAFVGAFGAYVVRPLMTNISPIGVALTCALTTAIAVAALFSDLDIGGKFLALMIAYPVGLIASNLVKLPVRILDPMVAVFVGGMILTPMALTAFFCAVLFKT